MTAYETKTWPSVSTTITPVDVERWTEKSVWVTLPFAGVSCRTVRNGTHNQYHETWLDAKRFLLKRLGDIDRDLRTQSANNARMIGELVTRDPPP